MNIKYDNFEAHSVCAYNDKGQAVPKDSAHQQFCEQLTEIKEDERDFVFFSVYGHIPDLGLECVGDFDNEIDAEYSCKMLNQALIPEASTQ